MFTRVDALRALLGRIHADVGIRRACRFWLCKNARGIVKILQEHRQLNILGSLFHASLHI